MYRNKSKTKLFVTCDESQNITSICQLFEVIGPILGINFLKKKINSNVRNVFVTYENAADAEKAMRAFNGMTLPNSKIPLKIEAFPNLVPNCYYQENNKILKSLKNNIEKEYQTHTIDNVGNGISFQSEAEKHNYQLASNNNYLDYGQEIVSINKQSSKTNVIDVSAKKSDSVSLSCVKKIPNFNTDMLPSNKKNKVSNTNFQNEQIDEVETNFAFEIIEISSKSKSLEKIDQVSRKLSVDIKKEDWIRAESKLNKIDSESKEQKNCISHKNVENSIISHIENFNNVNKFNDSNFQIQQENEIEKHFNYEIPEISNKKIISKTSKIISTNQSVITKEIKLAKVKNKNKNNEEIKYNQAIEMKKIDVGKNQLDLEFSQNSVEKLETRQKNQMEKVQKIEQDSDVESLILDNEVNGVDKSSELAIVKNEKETEIFLSTKNVESLNLNLDKVESFLPNLKNAQDKFSIEKNDSDVRTTLCDDNSPNTNMETDSLSTNNSQIEKINVIKNKKRTYSDVIYQEVLVSPEVSPMLHNMVGNKKLHLTNRNPEIRPSNCNDQKVASIESKDNISDQNALIALKNNYSDYEVNSDENKSNAFNTNQGELNISSNKEKLLIINSNLETNPAKTLEKSSIAVNDNKKSLKDQNESCSDETKKTKWDCKSSKSNISDKNFNSLNKSMGNRGIFCILYNRTYYNYHNILVDFSEFGLLDFIKVIPNKIKKSIYIYVKYINFKDAKKALTKYYNYYYARWADPMKLPDGFRDVDNNYDLRFHWQCNQLVNVRYIELHELCCNFQRNLRSRSQCFANDNDFRNNYYN